MMWDTKDGSVAVPRRTSPAVTALVVATMLIPGIGVQYIGSVIPEFEYSWTGWLVSIGLTALCIVVITIKNRRVFVRARALRSRSSTRSAGHQAGRRKRAFSRSPSPKTAEEAARRSRRRRLKRPAAVSPSRARGDTWRDAAVQARCILARRSLMRGPRDALEQHPLLVVEQRTRNSEP